MIAVLRNGNLIISLVGMLLWIAIALKYRRYWVAVILPVFYLLNVILFTLAALSHIFDSYTLNLWSASVRWISIILTAVVPLFILLDKWHDP